MKPSKAIKANPYGFRQHMEDRQREIAAEYNYRIVRIDTLHRQRKNDLTTAITTRKNVFSFNRCLRAVSTIYNVPIEDITGDNRRAAIVRARMHLYWVLYNERSDLPLMGVGNLVGRDHSTIIHGINKFERHPNKAGIIREVNEEVWRLYYEAVQENPYAGYAQSKGSSDSKHVVLRDEQTAYITGRHR